MVTTIHIKNMVCNRCISAVQQLLKEQGLDYTQISLGTVVLNKPLSDAQKQIFSKSLNALGFELIDDKKNRLIEQIKTEIRALVHNADKDFKTNLSHHLTTTLHHDYQQLSNLFSSVEGTTIEKYFIAQKIEKVKELLLYDELSLSEIAFRLNYSSVAYLSNQFKKVTGLTPSFYKSLKKDNRKPLDEV